MATYKYPRKDKRKRWYRAGAGGAEEEVRLGMVFRRSVLPPRDARPARGRAIITPAQLVSVQTYDKSRRCRARS